MHQENPDTFEVPSSDEIKRVVVGDYVKVSNGKERFWVQIIEKLTRGFFRGIVMNRLIIKTNYILGDTIQIHSRHIYDILYQRDMKKGIAQLEDE